MQIPQAEPLEISSYHQSVAESVSKKLDSEFSPRVSPNRFKEFCAAQ
jgi:hypothetical protein